LQIISPSSGITSAVADSSPQQPAIIISQNGTAK
jgi:hypothetical protein